MQLPTIRVVAAMVEEAGRYLITQRRPAAVLPLRWEFPGGRVEPGESDAEALEREVMHRLGVSVEIGKLISFVRHPYERYIVELHLYECRLSEGKPEKRNVNDFAWVQSDEFEHYPFTPADEMSVAQLLGISG
jgi:8-oxo-dGTP diphosphatase